MKTIKRGDKGDEVKTLQRALNITADGDFGPQTEAAVIAYQKSKGLEPDGIVGPMTWTALGVTNVTAAISPKCVDSSVVYMPLGCHVTKSAGRPIKYLAIHYTAGAISGAGAARKIHAIFTKRQASADFAVDDKEMVQFNPDLNNYYCWAVGDKKAARVNCPSGSNRNTISIEICSSLQGDSTPSKPNHKGWFFTEATLNNAARLAKILMKKYNIPIERVVRHYDISGKLCPGIVGWNDGKLYTKTGGNTNEYNNSAEWLKFKKRLQ